MMNVSIFNHTGCTNDASTSACAISQDHNQLGSVPHYDGYNAWRVGDKHLDWYGAEVGQGDFYGQKAEGTPAVWTTNDQSHPGYQHLNQYVIKYYLKTGWIAPVNINCDLLSLVYLF